MNEIINDNSSASHSTKQSLSWQVPVVLASICLGILLSLQLRTNGATKTNPHERVEQWNNMISLLNSYESERNKLSAELTEARARIKEIEEALMKRQSLQDTVKKQLEQARMQAGLVALKGPGVIVTMVDSPRHPGPGEDPYFYIVHDVDLNALVNELWAAGAEAIEVNGQRIVTRTAIRCVGPTILVNTVRLASPYTVKAIGPAADMEGGLRMPGGFIDSMSMLIKSGGEVKVKREDEVTVAAYQGSLGYRYAKPVKDTEEVEIKD